MLPGHIVATAEGRFLHITFPLQPKARAHWHENFCDVA